MVVTTCREYFDLYLKHDQCLPRTVSSLFNLHWNHLHSAITNSKLTPLSKAFYHKPVTFLSDRYFHIKKNTHGKTNAYCVSLSNGLFVDTIRKCAFCFPAPVAVLQRQSPNVLLNKMRSPNEIVPAITRKSIENVQQLLQSQFIYTDRIVLSFSLCSKWESYSAVLLYSRALDHFIPLSSISLWSIWSESVTNHAQQLRAYDL